MFKLDKIKWINYIVFMQFIKAAEHIMLSIKVT